MKKIAIVLGGVVVVCGLVVAGLFIFIDRGSPVSLNELAGTLEWMANPTYTQRLVLQPFPGGPKDIVIKGVEYPCSGKWIGDELSGFFYTDRDGKDTVVVLVDPRVGFGRSEYRFRRMGDGTLVVKVEDAWQSVRRS